MAGPKDLNGGINLIMTLVVSAWPYLSYVAVWGVPAPAVPPVPQHGGLGACCGVLHPPPDRLLPAPLALPSQDLQQWSVQYSTVYLTPCDLQQ